MSRARGRSSPRLRAPTCSTTGGPTRRLRRACAAAPPDRGARPTPGQVLTRPWGRAAGVGRMDEAVALLRGAIVLADESGHIDHGLRARNNLRGERVRGHAHRAQLPVLDESVDIARRFGMAGHLALNLHGRADSRFTLGCGRARAGQEEVDGCPGEARRARAIQFSPFLKRRSVTRPPLAGASRRRSASSVSSNRASARRRSIEQDDRPHVARRAGCGHGGP